ncbi:MAG TPA: hypothetical protein VFU88_07705 [Ktedonobacterales bacterium]|nr:hypothetical protein [Ktedonobacterales bacterium]
MLVNCYPPEDVVARVREFAGQTGPVLVQLNRLLDEKWRKVYKAGTPHRLFTAGDLRAA